MQSHATEKEARGEALSPCCYGPAPRRQRASTWQATRPRYRLADCNSRTRAREKPLMPNDDAPVPPAPPEQTMLLRRIGETLRPYGDEALDAVGGTTLDAAARAWLDAGFADAEEVDDWLGARCLDPRRAQALDAAGVTPEQAALLTREGRGGYEETVAYKFAQGDLTLEEARRIITSDFWNS